MRKTFLLVSVCFVVSILGTTVAAGAKADNFAEAEPAKVVTVGGTPEQMGYQLARHFADEANYLVKSWLLPKLNRLGIRSRLWARINGRRMFDFTPGLYQREIFSQSRYSGIPFNFLRIANATADLMQIAASKFGCSTYVVMPGRSLSDSMMIGRNLDYPESGVLRSHWNAVVFRPLGRKPFLSIHLPGLSSVLTGINQAGVMLSVKVSDGYVRSKATPAGIIFRYVLEHANSAEEAVKLYLRFPRTAGFNVTITDPVSAFELESDAYRFAIREPSAYGLLYGANHFEASRLRNGPPKRDYRWPILSERDRDHELLSLHDVRDTIGSAAGFERGQVSTNVLAVFMDYGTGKLYFGSDPHRRGASAWGPLSFVDVYETLK